MHCDETIKEKSKEEQSSNMAKKKRYCTLLVIIIYLSYTVETKQNVIQEDGEEQHRNWSRDSSSTCFILFLLLAL